MKTRWWIPVALLGVVGVGAWGAYEVALSRYGVSELNVGAGLLLRRVGLGTSDGPVHTSVVVSSEADIQIDPDIVPFEDVGHTLGPRALSEHVFLFHGAAVFDANDDGWLDLYLPQTGRPIGKKTTDGVLQEAFLDALPSTLLLNQGPDADGNPQFVALQDLVTANDTYVREELLIEEKYRPRTSAGDDEHGPGRVSIGAVAADFDGDGRKDLYVLNHHNGLGFQTDQLGMRVYPARENLGRDAIREPFVNRTPSFLWQPLEDGLHATVTFGETPEREGRNSLYRNLGDRDGDGLPEWEDITDQVDIGGRFSSSGASVADFDRDGDLDVYVTNFTDPDFWGFGDTHFGGQRNQLYVNQLVETGTLSFVNRAEDLGVAGLHVEEEMGSGPYVPSEGAVRRSGRHIVDGEQVGEEADHSWASAFTDLDGDGWLDLVVANDTSNRLRVYLNREGTFERQTEFDDPLWDGSWMGMNTGDLDGDLVDDVFVSNFGGQVMSVRNNALMIDDDQELNIGALSAINVPDGNARIDSVIVGYRPQEGWVDAAASIEIQFHPSMAPDMARPQNMVRAHRDFHSEGRFADGLAGVEFAWNAAFFDVENDGDLDLYIAGGLMRPNDNFMGDLTSSPGRMLVNHSTPGQYRFVDRTLDYRLLDVRHVDYDAPVPERPAPGTRWHKRDTIRLTDLDAYAGSGLEASDDSAIHDLYRVSEAATGIYSADFNRDGYADLLVTHMGGYDSLEPSARNLKVSFAGRLLSVPAPNKVMKPPTQFEPGHTSLYVHRGPPRGTDPNWVRIRLLDDGPNRFAVGARITVNGRISRSVDPTGPAFGGVSDDVLVGLGDERLTDVEVVWPSGALEPERYEVPEGSERGDLCIHREHGVVACDS